MLKGLALGPMRWLSQYTKFGMVGLTATAVHVGVFTLLIERLGVKALLANFAAFCMAFLVSYFGNFHWTFKLKPGAQINNCYGIPTAFIKFIMVAITGLMVNSLIVYLTIDILKFSYTYAIFLMIGVTPAIVFTLSKFWAFRAEAG